MSEAIAFIAGLIAMMIVWFVNDNSPETSPYRRGYEDGYKHAMEEYKVGDGMNHDYTHCFDQTDDCPKDCFRAQLNDDLKLSDMICRPLSWSHLKGTEECPRKDGKNGT